MRRHRFWLGAVALALLFSVSTLLTQHQPRQDAPRTAVVINTWPFVNATRAAFAALKQKRGRAPALDAIENGCNRCEVDQCDFTVGYGGSPDSNGETTLDAMILDGSTMEMGAVARLRRVKPAIKVARAVMEHSAHSILTGDGALEFAKMMGFAETALDTPHSREVYDAWRSSHCQPNYFRNVIAQNTSCPPYTPLHRDIHSVKEDVYLDSTRSFRQQNSAGVERLISENNHDTIGMVVLGEDGHMTGERVSLCEHRNWPAWLRYRPYTCETDSRFCMRLAAGTSSNGATHKIAG